MTATTPPNSSETNTQAYETIELAPSYTLPITLVVLAIPIALLQVWIGAIVALLGLFLMFQTVAIRLQFTESALDVYRSTTLLRRFPYSDWQNWEIFWPKVPILFYFREVKSIHFLPVLFDPQVLKSCLETRIPKS